MARPRSLGAAATRGAAVTLVGQGVRVVVQFAGIVLLARLLSPTDYGLTAMVSILIGLGELFRDFGLSSAAIQARELSRGQQSNLFWANTAIGLTLAVLACTVAPLVARFFGDPRLTLLTMAMSLIFVFNGLSTQYRANLARTLKFLPLTSTELAGQVGGLVVGVGMALGGAGYWALAGQQVAQGICTFVGLLAVTRWVPSWVRRGDSIRPFLGYGSNLLGTQLLAYLTRNTDTLVIGARFGASVLGIYSRGFQLVMMPLLQVQAPSTRVALPVLARLQDQRERFAEFILLGQVALLTMIGVLFAFLFAQAPAVVAVALGSRWADVAPIFRILLIAGFFQAAGYATYWVFLAKGLMRANLLYALATRPAVAALLVVGSIWGSTGVAAALAVANFLIWPTSLIWIARVSDAPARAMFGNGMRTALVCAVAAVASMAATAPLPPHQSLLRLLVGLGALVAAVAATALVWPRFRADLADILRIRRYLRRRVAPGAAS